MKNRASQAVMEQRARGEILADDETRAMWRKLDWFATPPWASRAGAELVKRLDPAALTVWECACGDGIMAECLDEYFPGQVSATDICPQRYGQEVDFIGRWPAGMLAGGDDWVITNPPFGHAEAFVRRGLTVARRGVAVLCRLAFLESSGRHALHFEGDTPLTVLAPFAERVPMQLGPWNPKCSTATAYAWFVYVKADPLHVKGWNAEPRIVSIPPGTRARLTKADDVARFAPKAELPLFGKAHQANCF